MASVWCRIGYHVWVYPKDDTGRIVSNDRYCKRCGKPLEDEEEI